MTEPQYRYAHQQERAKWEPVVAAGQATCAEPRCMVEEAGGSRWIVPGSPWHLSHDVTGTVWLGPSHRRCNLAEAARRRNAAVGRQRGRRGHRPKPPAVDGRWVL